MHRAVQDAFACDAFVSRRSLGLFMPSAGHGPSPVGEADAEKAFLSCKMQSTDASSEPELSGSLRCLFQRKKATLNCNKTSERSLCYVFKTNSISFSFL